MELSLLSELATVFALSVGVIYTCHKIKVPPIVGFLLTGMAAGPHGLGLVSAIHEVEIMAEVGIVMLLFTIGLELSLGDLLRIKKPVFFGGAAQLILTVLLFTAVALTVGLTAPQAVFAGFLAALSSTAIVLKILQERAETDAPQGRVSLAILIFQDIAVVPMMLFIPILAGHGGDSMSMWMPLAKGLAIIVLVFIVARKAVPHVMHAVAKTRSRELFLLFTLVFCLSVALLTSKLGLSLSLGAFMAGLIMAESEYSLSAVEGIMPFRDVFTSLFFVSVGMLLDTQYLFNHLPLALGAAALVLILKGAAASGSAWFLGYPIRPVVLVGLALCQIGEFSFILAKVGLDQGLIDAEAYQLFLAASVITMISTPFLISASPRLAESVSRLGALSRLPKRPLECEMEGACHLPEDLSEHLIIIGFGVGGRHLARAAKVAGVRYVVLEMNPETVRKSAADGEPISYGDASQTAVLEHAGIAQARVLAVVISDPVAVRRVTDLARKLNPAIRIIARTRFVGEIQPLMDLGADDVIPEEFETSIEIFTRVMAEYLTPRQDIERFTAEIRQESYDMLREVDVRGEPLTALRNHFTGMDVAAFTVAPGAALAGKSLVESDLRRRCGLTVVAVKSGENITANPEAGTILQPGDIAYVFGSRPEIASGAVLFEGPKVLSLPDQGAASVPS